MPKGHYDRAASAWRPPPRKTYPPELVQAIRDAYEAGHTILEVSEIVGMSAKVVYKAMVRHDIPRRPAARRYQLGPANHAWAGDEAGYQALHLRVQAARGKPCLCEFCGVDDEGIKYEWANKTGAYADLDDYLRLCIPCHRLYDAARRKATGRRTSPERR
jgi:predicted DNA-binding transcriptional regulator AlpA